MQNRGQDIKASSLQDTLMTKESKTEETPPLTSIPRSTRISHHQPSETHSTTSSKSTVITPQSEHKIPLIIIHSTTAPLLHLSRSRYQ
jgi:hypothetical protein